MNDMTPKRGGLPDELPPNIGLALSLLCMEVLTVCDEYRYTVAKRELRAAIQAALDEAYERGRKAEYGVAYD